MWDRLVDVHETAVEVHGEASLLGSLSVFEAGRPERDVVGVPRSDSVVRVVGGVRLVDHGAHSVLRSISVQDLDLVPVLQVDPAIAALVRDEELDVEAEVAILLLGDDVGGAILAARRGRIVRHEHGAVACRVVDDLPFDRER